MPSDPTVRDQHPCPSREDLSAFRQGQLAADVRELIDSHVSLCAACQTVVEGLAGGRQAAAGGPTPVRPVTVRPEALRLGPVLPFRLGQYDVVEKIGRGGMGWVYRAIHARLKKAFALKVLSPEGMEDPHALARFQREMEAVGRLDHPNIVRATDAGEADGVHYLVMELIDGTDLYRVVRQHGPLRVADACAVIRQAAAGLQCVHEHRLVHRDIKPSNLLLTSQGEVKVVDLGLALLRAEGSGAALGLTEDHQAMGTADFMAPEQWESSRGVDIRADVYSLGCTLYALLTGRPPYAGEEYGSALRKMAAHATRPLPSVSQVRPDVPAGLEALLKRLAAKRAEERPSTPAEVGQALEPYCRGADLRRLARPAVGVSLAPGRTVAELPADGSAVIPPWEQATSPLGAQTVPYPRRSRWVATAAVMLVVAGVSIGLAAWRANQGGRAAGDGEPDKPTAAKAAVLPEGDKAPPREGGGPRMLLRDRPFPRVWVHGLGNRFDLDEKKGVLWVSCSESALLKLGETYAQDYRLQVALRQKQWAGGVGVFFGGRPGQPPQLYEFQMVHLVRPPPELPGRTFTLRRAVGLVVEPPDAKVQSFDYEDFVSQNVERPTNQDYVLDLRVTGGRLGEVRWNGVPCGNLVKADAGARVKDLDGRGEFGVFCCGDLTVTSAHIFE